MSKKLKLLPANPDISNLQERRELLNNIVDELRLSIEKLPEGSLHLVKSSRGTQYYHRTDSKDKSGKYIRKSDQAMVYELAQKDYSKKVLLLAEQEIKQIDRFLSKYSPSKLSNEYSGLLKERKELIVPIAMSNADYAKIWQEEVYIGKEFMDNAKEYYTRKGERVRSKSEIIIANMLSDNNIPYRYECPLEMKNGIRIYPDFTVLNMKTREVKYLEHLGMMDDEEYRENALERIKLYEKNGYLLGKNVLVSYETGKSPIDQKLLQQKIDCFLK